MGRRIMCGAKAVILPPDHPSSTRRRRPHGAGLAALIFSCGLLQAASSTVWAAPSLPPDQVRVQTPAYNVATPKGAIRELWRYVFSWKGLPVGYVTIAGAEAVEGDERVMRVRVAGRTNAFIDLIWRYRLEAGGSLRLDPIAPESYYATEVEEAKRAVTKIDFDRARRVKTFRQKGEKVKQFEFDAPNTYEFLSTIWLLLNVDYEPGKVYRVDTLTGASRYILEVAAEAREIVEVDGLPVDTFRLRATTSEVTDPENKIATKHRETRLWVNTDWPRRLLRADVATKWGTVRLELTGVENISDLPPAEELERSSSSSSSPPAAARPDGPVRPHQSR
jgi:hypothetical protein